MNFDVPKISGVQFWQIWNFTGALIKAHWVGSSLHSVISCNLNRVNLWKAFNFRSVHSLVVHYDFATDGWRTMLPFLQNQEPFQGSIYLRPDGPDSGWGWLERMAGAFLILLYFCGEPGPIKAVLSGQGKTKKGFLCATLCDIKMNGYLDLYQV